MKRIVVLALGLLVAACSETPTEAPTMDVPPVAMNIADAPLESGVVYRGDRPVFLVLRDGDSGLQLSLGRNSVEFCADPGNVNLELALVPFQRVDFGDGLVQEILQGEDVVADVTAIGDFRLCSTYRAPNVIAVGTASYVRTDNDLLGVAGGERERANAFGTAAHGKVTMIDGSPMDLSGIIRQRIVQGELSSIVQIVLSGPEN